MTTNAHHSLPQGWELKRLGDIVVSSQYGLSIPTTDDGTIPMFKMNNFKHGKMNPDKVDKANLTHSDFRKYRLNVGDILFNRTNSAELVGKTGIFDLQGDYTFASYLVRFVINREEATPEYINAYFNSEKAQAFFKEIATKGVSQANINPTNLQKYFTIPLPPLPEQRQIAAVLSTWDRAIEQTTDLLNALRTRHRGLMQRLLTGKVRLPGFEDEWQTENANEVFRSVSIRNHPHEPLLSATQERGVIPRSMLEGRVVMPESEVTEYKLVVPGDFIISLRSFQGGIECSNYRGIVSPAYTVLKPKDKIAEGFYRHYFKSTRFISQLSVAVIGIRDGKQISFEDFSSIRIPSPPLAEQQAIAQVLDTSLREIRQQQSRLETLREQKRGLMQQLLTGRVRVPTTVKQSISEIL